MTRADVDRALSHLVLSERVLDQLGPAVNGGHSLFVYGPPGNGKTVISQGITNLLDGDIAIPHAIERDGHLVQVFDPVVHEARAARRRSTQLDTRRSPDAPLAALPPPAGHGRRRADAAARSSWRYNAGVRLLPAPVQLAGQRRRARHRRLRPPALLGVDLLNRWITPLESRIDYLTLQSGQKLPVPFVVLVVFATNIKPADLVDEAFLRRIHYKVFAENPTVPTTSSRSSSAAAASAASPTTRRSSTG